MNLLEIATRYFDAGLALVPIRRGEKAPRFAEWQHFMLRGEPDLARYFADGNIGVILGARSGGLVDVDLDCSEAIELAPSFLPATRTFGRRSKPRSHFIYKADPLVGTAQFRDPHGGMLCELRSTGGQTVFPPSTHPSGEAIRWTFGEVGPIATVAGDELRAAVGRLAAAVLERRHPEADDRVRATAARWRGEAERPVTRPLETSPPSSGHPLPVIERARRYADRWPPAIQGQGTGNHQTYKLALDLVQGFELSDSDALSVLEDFGRRCKPPWSRPELAQKIASARKNEAGRAPGYLLRASPRRSA